jgi:hypothetical protein
MNYARNIIVPGVALIPCFVGIASALASEAVDRSPRRIASRTIDPASPVVTSSQWDVCEKPLLSPGDR